MARLLLTMLLGTWALNGPPAAASPPTHLIAYVRHGSLVTLRNKPFGSVVGRVGATTVFGSQRALGVLTSRHGRWLGVTEAGVADNRIVWLDAHKRGLQYVHTGFELTVDLSRRALLVRRGRQAARSIRVDVGRPGSPTPTGRFAVTDKLDARRYSAAYGCCILALSATQPHLPAGWLGGDRIAIHGTQSQHQHGHAISAGCLHASDEDLRYLMRTVPLGTPIAIRR
jgi:L,D-transpeptidase catalytic domain